MCWLPMRYSRYSGTAAVQQVQQRYSSGTAGTAAVQQRCSRYTSGTAYTPRFAVPCTGYSRYSRYSRYSGTARYRRYSRPSGLSVGIGSVSLYFLHCTPALFSSTHAAPQCADCVFVSNNVSHSRLGARQEAQTNLNGAGCKRL